MVVKPRNSSRRSNVFTINVPQMFKALILEKAQTFGGASQLVSLAIEELAVKVKKFTNRLSIIEEYNDFMKIETLLMRKYFEEKKEGKDTKLSFRIRDHVALESLRYLKKRTGWNTSKVVRMSILLYLFSNYSELLVNEDALPFLTCPHCGYITFDQQLLNEHIMKFHIKICKYCGKPYLITEEHHCPQKALILASQNNNHKIEEEVSDTDIEAISDILKREQELLTTLQLKENQKSDTAIEELTSIDSLIKEKVILNNSENKLAEISEELEEIGGPFVSLADESEELIEEDDYKRKDKKETTKSLDKLQSEIKEMLKELKEDGLLD